MEKLILFSNNGTKKILNVERIDETTIYGKDVNGKNLQYKNPKSQKLINLILWQL
jgi:hypothetical protein